MKKIITTFIVGCITLLGANEIKPFGKFNFGDSFSSIHSSICSIESIEKISLQNDVHLFKADFCKSKKNALKLFDKYYANKFNQRMMEKINMQGFNHLIWKPAMFIVADSVIIQGVKYKLWLEFNTTKEGVVGSYLLNQNDSIKLDTKIMPMQLSNLELKLNNSDFNKVHQESVFKILWKKYDKFVKSSEDKERFLKTKTFHVEDKNKNSIRYDGYSINYDGLSYVLKLQTNAVTKYLKEQAQNVDSGSSNDL